MSTIDRHREHVIKSATQHVPVSQTARQAVHEKYSLLKQIGEGGFAKIFLAICKKTNRMVAIKHIKRHESNWENCFVESRVMKILQKNPHPNVAQCFEIFDDEHDLYLVLEYLSGGDLLSFLTSCGAQEENFIQRTFHMIVSAVKHLHSLHIVHRDIKLENILLDQYGTPKVIDFNLAGFWSPKLYLKKYCGSKRYSAPEIHAGHPYHGPEIDVWSLGVLLYTMLYLCFPFNEKSESKPRDDTSSVDESQTMSSQAGSSECSSIKSDGMVLTKNVLMGNYIIPPNPYSEESSSLVQKMLIVSPVVRPSINDILTHSWFKEFQVAPVECKQTTSVPVLNVLNSCNQSPQKKEPKKDTKKEVKKDNKKDKQTKEAKKRFASWDSAFVQFFTRV